MVLSLTIYYVLQDGCICFGAGSSATRSVAWVVRNVERSKKGLAWREGSILACSIAILR